MAQGIEKASGADWLAWSTRTYSFLVSCGGGGGSATNGPVVPAPDDDA